MTEQIVWQTPPPLRRRLGSAKYADFVAALRANPGQWAVLPSDGTQTYHQATAQAASIKGGKSRAFDPPSEFEITSRQGKVYCRWIGTNEETKP